MSSLLTLNYFIRFPSFPIVDFEQVNICWENYLTFCSLDICFNVSTWRKARLNKEQCREFRYFSYFTHSVRCSLSKPSITQIIHSRNTGRFV